MIDVNFGFAALGSMLVGSALGVVLTAVVALTVKLIARPSAATRFAIWMATLVAVVLLPILHFVHENHRELSAPRQTTATPQVHAAMPLQQPEPRPAPLGNQNPSDPAPAQAADWSLTILRHDALDMVAAYVSLLSVLLLRLVAGYLRLVWMRRRTRPAPADMQQRLMHWLALCPTHRNVELRVSDSIRSPLAIGFRRPSIVMPASLVFDVSMEDFDQLGVHELAHIRRYDDWTNLFQRILRAVFFFHPGVHWLARAANFDREVACDDWVVAATGGPKRYAQCLAKVVEIRAYGRGFALASGATFRKRQIFRRVEMLMKQGRESRSGISAITVVLTVLSLLGFATQLAETPGFIAFSHGPSMKSNWTSDGREIHLELHGRVMFSDDDKTVEAMEPGSYFFLQEQRGWTRRAVQARPDASGNPEVTYLVNGRETDMDDLGRAWLAGLLPGIIREHGFNAPARVERILARKGVDGVLEEIGLIRNDGAKRQYISGLARTAKLGPAEVRRLIREISRISSDGEKAASLGEIISAHRSAVMETGFFEAVDTIHSDGERRRVLILAVEVSGDRPGVIERVAGSVRRMNSDGEKAAVLAFAANHRAGQPVSAAALKAAGTINSDGEKAKLLTHAVDAYTESAEHRQAFFDVLDSIHSDGERARVLSHLLDRAQLQNPALERIAASAQAIDSDGEKARVLQALASRYLHPPLFTAINTIHSDGEKMRVLMTLLDRDLPPAAISTVIQSVSAIGSDSEKAKALEIIARRATDPETRAAVQRAAEGINSDNDYRRVASALLSNAQPSTSSR